MLTEKHTGSESGIMRAAVRTFSPRRTRVRLLVAIPAVIVLLLCFAAGVYYWMADAFLSTLPATTAESRQDFSRYWLMFLLIFAVAGALIGYVLAWSLTRPIQDMIRFSERVASGDLNSKVPVTRHDEMGELGSSFNHMVESLNHFIATRNRFILESFSGGLIVTDLNGTITAVNSTAEKLLGIQSEIVSGKSIREVFANSELSSLLKYYERVVWKQETLVNKQLSLDVNNQLHQVTVSFTVMRDSSGQTFGVIINVRDLAEMEQFYRQMRNSDRLATMGTFASGLAHEIKNPLGAIKGTAQLLAEDLGSNHPSAPYLHVIQKEVNRLDQLIQEVQAYSQPAAEKVPTDLNRLIRETINFAQTDPKSQEKSFRMETDLSEDFPPVNVAKNQFRQALLNILINAADAVKPDGIIRVTSQFDKNAAFPVKVSVANQGQPLSDETATKIFEPFFTTKPTGNGLGLSIAYQVAVNHGGEVIVTSNEGWVTFTLQFKSKISADASAEKK